MRPLTDNERRRLVLLSDATHKRLVAADRARKAKAILAYVLFAAACIWAALAVTGCAIPAVRVVVIPGDYGELTEYDVEAITLDAFEHYCSERGLAPSKFGHDLTITVRDNIWQYSGVWVAGTYSPVLGGEVGVAWLSGPEYNAR